MSISEIPESVQEEIFKERLRRLTCTDTLDHEDILYLLEKSGYLYLYNIHDMEYISYNVASIGDMMTDIINEVEPEVMKESKSYALFMDEIRPHYIISASTTEQLFRTL